MLEVHAPHERVHTWKDFIVHIATIVVGLVIAVGLEQSVEAIRHRHQRSELRERLERESEQILRDARNTDAALADFTAASPEELHTYLGLLSAESEATDIFREWYRNIQGAEDTILHGELGLKAILAAERKLTDAHPTRGPQR